MLEGVRIPAVTRKGRGEQDDTVARGDIAASPLAVRLAQMDVSRNGSMVYRRSAAGGQFVVDLTDAAGRVTPFFARHGHYLWPRVSPDGQRVASTRTDGGKNSVWVYDARRDETVRLGDVGGTAEAPLWTHDGERCGGFFQSGVKRHSRFIRTLSMSDLPFASTSVLRGAGP
jgi:dipeptidyl aminopeptidase/acylaminoacyl peptidase